MRGSACARPTRKRGSRRPPRSARWRRSCGVAARATTSRYNVAREQRLTGWRRPGWGRGQGRGVTRFPQEAEWKAIRDAVPQSAASHAHVLPDGRARRDKPSQAFFRRLAAGEKSAGVPRYQGRTRSHSFTDKAAGTGARLDNGELVLSKIGRIAVRWSRPVQGSIKPVTGRHEAEGW